MAWKMTDEDRAALLAAVRNPEPVKAGETLSLMEAYALELGKLRGMVETALLMLTPLEPEPEPEREPDSTPELDIF